MTRAATTTPQVRAFDRDGVTIVVPPGPRLDAEVAGAFRATLLQLLDQGSRRLVLDLAAVEFIDSSGLGALVAALKRLKQLDARGDIRLAHVQPSVVAVLEIIRLHRVFPPFASVGDAMRNFQTVV